jgi:hypothetical protein
MGESVSKRTGRVSTATTPEGVPETVRDHRIRGTPLGASARGFTPVCPVSRNRFDHTPAGTAPGPPPVAVDAVTTGRVAGRACPTGHRRDGARDEQCDAEDRRYRSPPHLESDPGLLTVQPFS